MKKRLQDIVLSAIDFSEAKTDIWFKKTTIEITPEEAKALLELLIEKEEKIKQLNGIKI